MLETILPAKRSPRSEITGTPINNARMRTYARSREKYPKDIDFFINLKVAMCRHVVDKGYPAGLYSMACQSIKNTGGAFPLRVFLTMRNREEGMRFNSIAQGRAPGYSTLPINVLIRR